MKQLISFIFIFLIYGTSLSFTQENTIPYQIDVEQPSEILAVKLNPGDSIDVNGVIVYIDEKGKCRALVPIPDNRVPKRVLRSNEIIVGAGVSAMVILYALPESVTNWDRSELNWDHLVSNWKEHVREGPVIDEDNFFLNWVMHPYFGSVYYLTLRGAGYKWWESGLYSAGMSTFFWEYGIEALAEVPSWQDLIITPVVGSGLGEALYQGKIKIKRSDDKILDSRVVGRTALFLIDPLNEVQDIFIRRKSKRGNCDQLKIESNLSLYQNKYPGLNVTLTIQ